MHLRNDRIGVFDLSSGEAYEEELGDTSSWRDVSSVLKADKLLSDHGRDSIVLGTGVLTSSLVPAACAGIISSKSGTVPLLGHAGVEVKLSGFDFLVVKGRADPPGYLWVRDGIIEFVPSEEMGSMDSWGRTDKVRTDQGDGKVQVISVGHWGDSGSLASQLVVNHWGGEDKAGAASAFGTKNLLAIAFRGMGEIELADPERHFEEATLMIREHAEKLGRSEGLSSYCELAKSEDFRKILHRPIACYGCPHPCRSFAKVFEEPGEMKLVSKEPGFLHYDIPALASAFEAGFTARDATDALVKCARAGAEPVSVLSRVSSIEEVARFISDPASATPSHPANFESSFEDRQRYLTCLGLGLCPRYWAKVGFDLSAIVTLGEAVLGTALPIDET